MTSMQMNTQECIKECAMIAKNRFSQLEEFWEAIFKGLSSSFVYLNGFVAVQMIYKSSSSVYKGVDMYIYVRLFTSVFVNINI